MIYFHCHVQICLQIGSDTCVSVSPSSSLHTFSWMRCFLHLLMFFFFSFRTVDKEHLGLQNQSDQLWVLLVLCSGLLKVNTHMKKHITFKSGDILSFKMSIQFKLWYLFKPQRTIVAHGWLGCLKHIKANYTFQKGNVGYLNWRPLYLPPAACLILVVIVLFECEDKTSWYLWSLLHPDTSSHRVPGWKSQHAGTRWTVLSWSWSGALLDCWFYLSFLLSTESHWTLQLQCKTQAGELHLPCV